MFPVFSIIFDEDVDIKIALQFPPLYRSLQKGRDLNGKTFMIWVWKAIYQGVVIILLSLALFKNIFLELETVCFTALIFTEYVMTLTEVCSNTSHTSDI
jgi:phospholipid-translocating ATPase